MISAAFPVQAVEAAQLAEDLKVQLEHVQCKLKEIQTCMAENRAAKEKESFNLKRAQVPRGRKECTFRDAVQFCGA